MAGQVEVVDGPAAKRLSKHGSIAALSVRVEGRSDDDLVALVHAEALDQILDLLGVGQHVVDRAAIAAPSKVKDTNRSKKVTRSSSA
mgnify:CR=1 FL=1